MANESNKVHRAWRAACMILVGVVIAQGWQTWRGGGAPPAAPPARSVVVELSVPVVRQVRPVIETHLADLVPSVDYEKVPLDAAIEHLRKQTKANIVMDWEAIEAYSQGRKTPVTLHAKAVALEKVLQLLLESGDFRGTVLETTEADGVVHITSRDRIGQFGQRSPYAETRLYKVRALIDNEAKYLEEVGRPWMSRYAPPGPANLGDVRAMAEASLVELIRCTVHPDEWRDNGGTAMIVVWSGDLLITAPHWVHQEVEKLVALLSAGNP